MTRTEAAETSETGSTAEPVRVEGSETPIAATSSETPAQITAARTAREERYNELLRAAPPAPPAPPKEEPSLLQRVVSPIANALGISSRPASQPSPQLRPQHQQTQRLGQQQQPPPQDSPQQEQGRGGEQTTTDPQQNDPDTDTQPPGLLAADFTPPQIQDGEETMFAAVVTDNLSGVRSVSGVISSPSNALQGFACQREGETNRFVARITIPRDAAEGLWTVKYLTLSDAASNSVNLNAAMGQLPASATFRVSSRQSDSTGPTLGSVRVQNPNMKAGEKNTIFVTADDDKSGVALVSGVFVSPAKAARLGFGCRLGGGGEWECPLSPPECIDCGSWTLEQIQLQDKANNMVTFRADNPIVKAVTVEIAGDHCDATPPDLTSLTLDPPAISNVEGGVVIVTATIVDEECGVASLSGQAVPPSNVGGARLYFSLESKGDGKTFVGKIVVPAKAAKGVWTISWLQALDNAHNLKAYSATNPILKNATFRVE